MPTFSSMLGADLCKKLLQRAVKRDGAVDEQVGLNRGGPMSCLTSAQPMDETVKVFHLFKGGQELFVLLFSQKKHQK